MIKRFGEYDINEGQDDKPFEDEVKHLNIDLSNYDKTKYQGIDSSSAKIKWDARMVYSKSGISDIEISVESIDFFVAYEKAEDGEIDEQEFSVTDGIEVEMLDKIIPCYVNEISYDFKTKKCSVSFGNS